jgi:protein-S-isoprenylcysteine O-methyltransferase Ste14
MTTRTYITWPQMREYLSNLVLAMLYASFAENFFVDYQATGRLSDVFYIAFELVVVAVSLCRRPPVSLSWKIQDWLYAITGTALPLVFMPVPQESQTVWFGVQLLGAAISMTGILSINRSFGVVPANRGIKTSGLYRFVRHPIYAGYFITATAMVAQNQSMLNLGIAIAHYLLQILRIIREERFLLQDAAYAQYAARVRWRLLPGVW